MGLTKATDAAGLSLELDKPRDHYSPGDTISGRVELNTAADSAIGSVVVSFWGRAKSRIVQQNGQSVTYHRGRTQFFKHSQTLYEGQYTHKPGSFSWPFEFVVPHQADADSVLSSDSWKPKEHYSSTRDPEGGLNLTLPPTMYHSRLTFGRKVESFIEYVLEATLTEPAGLHHIRKAQSKTSTFPLAFYPLSTPEPMQRHEFALTRHERHFTISTLKLLPEHAGTSLGIRERARSIFQRDTIPRFSFQLAVQAPSVIQLFHPRPIPFLVTAVADLTPDNTTVAELPVVTLRSARIQLRAQTRCRAAGTYADTKTYEIPLWTGDQLDHVLPMSGDLDRELDLGALCDLRLGNAKLGSRVESPLCPNFRSYNVAREYTLTWELELECADKTEKFSSPRTGPQCTVVMPPATLGVDFGAQQDTLTLESLLLSTDAKDEREDIPGDGQRRRRITRRTGEKEKPGFGPPRVGAVTSTSKSKSKAEQKAEEAAQDRPRPRSHQVLPSYSVHDAAPPLDADLNADPNARLVGSDVNGNVDVDVDQALPKYVP